MTEPTVTARAWQRWGAHIHRKYPAGKQWFLGEMEAEMATDMPDVFHVIFPEDDAATAVEHWRRVEALSARMRERKEAHMKEQAEGSEP